MTVTEDSHFRGVPADVLRRNVVSHRLVRLKAIFAWAVRNKGIKPLKENPADGFKPDPIVKSNSPESVFTADEALAVIEHAFETRAPVLAHFVESCFLTGVRRGEACGLKWRKVYFDHGSEYQNGVLIDRSFDQLTKNKQPRWVPMPPQLVRSMKEWKAATPYSGDNDFVFPAGFGHYMPGNPRMRTTDFAFSKLLKAVAESVGIDKREITGHSTRKSYASWCQKAGVPRDITGTIIGHKGTALLDTVYSHYSTEDLRQAITRVEFPSRRETDHEAEITPLVKTA